MLLKNIIFEITLKEHAFLLTKKDLQIKVSYEGTSIFTLAKPFSINITKSSTWWICLIVVIISSMLIAGVVYIIKKKKQGVKSTQSKSK